MPIVVEWGPSQADAMQHGARAGQNIEQFARTLQMAQWLQQARQQASELQLGRDQLGQQESQFARTLPLQERATQVQERGQTLQEEVQRRQLELEAQQLAQQQRQYDLTQLYNQDAMWRQQQIEQQRTRAQMLAAQRVTNPYGSLFGQYGYAR